MLLFQFRRVLIQLFLKLFDKESQLRGLVCFKILFKFLIFLCLFMVYQSFSCVHLLKFSILCLYPFLKVYRKIRNALSNITLKEFPLLFFQEKDRFAMLLKDFS